MKTAQHTPGPWHIEKQRAPNGATYYRIHDTDDIRAVIAQVIGDGRIEYHENVRLIAAAPDLLAALQDLANYVGGWDEPSSHPCGKARDAIAKALGNQ
jgi:hypothetical protein